MRQTHGSMVPTIYVAIAEYTETKGDRSARKVGGAHAYDSLGSGVDYNIVSLRPLTGTFQAHATT